MATILAISEIQGEAENLLKFLNYIKKNEVFDYVVFNGDLINFDDEEEVAEILIEILKILEKPIITVPGNNDGKIIELLKKETFSVHNDYKIFDNIAFFGFGGAKTPIGTTFEPSEEEFKLALESLYKKIQNVKTKVLVTHMPPKDTKLDLIFSGAHVGSEAIREFILKYQPTLAICSHIIEAFGVDRLGNTFLINPGRITEGNYAIIKLQQTIEIKIKNIINLLFREKAKPWI
ncbi:MAG: metallophosphoesterase [Candidatus Aenigmatarchaeota archaeon]